MKKRWLIPIIAMFMAVLFNPENALADGIIVPDVPPDVVDDVIPVSQLNIRYHRVDVEINDQIVTTHVDQVFYNPNDWTVEGTYIFPIPLGATVDSFTLWIDGEPVEGKVLDAEQARDTYEDIVMRMKDPALLEYAGQGAVQARIFPIPPHGERRIELSYSEVLSADNGLIRYLYPLNTEKFSLSPLEHVSISVRIHSSVPIRAAYSPSHQVVIDRATQYDLVAGYEDTNVLPDHDFVLYYSVGEDDGLHLISYMDPTAVDSEDGFFLLFLAPRPEEQVESVPKDVILVLDRSGSMDGEKFEQAREALGYILQQLNPEDRFNIISFSTNVETYANRLRPQSEANEAISWVDRLSAVGSTDINRALMEAAALSEPERPTYLIFLTDGLPTEGVTDSETILANFEKWAPDNLRLFAFGVGYDVDTYLLDSLSSTHQGSSIYVVPGERLDEKLSSFYAKISTPVMTDIELDFGDLGVYDLYPDPVPDLFLGSQVVLVGRYREGGTTDITLRGNVGDKVKTEIFRQVRFVTSSERFEPPVQLLPQLWATRKIGYLLKQIRLNGANKELVEQVVALSIRYGIVTPYTSYLVTEEQPLGADAREGIVEEELQAYALSTQTPTYGQEAVEKAVGQGALEDAETVYAPAPDMGSTIKTVAGHTFVHQDGVWIDTLFEPEWMVPVQVAFLSQDYFRLINAMPVMGDYFSIGSRVIVVAGSNVYEVVEQGSDVEPLDLPWENQVTDVSLDSSQQQTKTQQIIAEDNASQEPSGTSAFPCIAGVIPLLLIGAQLIKL